MSYNVGYIKYIKVLRSDGEEIWYEVGDITDINGQTTVTGHVGIYDLCLNGDKKIAIRR